MTAAPGPGQHDTPPQHGTGQRGEPSLTKFLAIDPASMCSQSPDRVCAVRWVARPAHEARHLIGSLDVRRLNAGRAVVQEALDSRAFEVRELDDGGEAGLADRPG